MVKQQLAPKRPWRKGNPLISVVYSIKNLRSKEEGLTSLQLLIPRIRLSGGQLQRTTARILVREPEVLVFDDLSSVLDVETEQKLWSRVFEQREPASLRLLINTYLVVSHRPIALQHAIDFICSLTAVIFHSIL